MIQIVTAALSGLLFGAGLVFSGMTDPYKVLGFLTLGPDWDPTLMFVMGGAILVAAPGFKLISRRLVAWDGSRLPQVSRGPIDRRLLLGGAMFGIGWGLSGYCPGPAVVSAGLGAPAALLMLPSMILGAYLAGKIPSRSLRP